MKKSSPGSPCTTIFSPSSNWTGSRASATVRRSHLSKDSVNGKYIQISKNNVLFTLMNATVDTQMCLCVFHSLWGCLLHKSSKLVGTVIPTGLIQSFIRDHYISDPAASSLFSWSLMELKHLETNPYICKTSALLILRCGDRDLSSLRLIQVHKIRERSKVLSQRQSGILEREARSG